MLIKLLLFKAAHIKINTSARTLHPQPAYLSQQLSANTSPTTSITNTMTKYCTHYSAFIWSNTNRMLFTICDFGMRSDVMRKKTREATPAPRAMYAACFTGEETGFCGNNATSTSSSGSGSGKAIMCGRK